MSIEMLLNVTDSKLIGEDCISSYLCHVGDAITSTSEDVCLDASIFQCPVFEDPVFQAVGAFASFTEENSS